MTQYRKNNPENSNFNQRDRNNYNQPTLRNQQGWREDYEPNPRNEYSEWTGQRTRNQQDRPFDFERDRNNQNQRNEQWGRNENLGYGQYNFNNMEDRQNPYNGYENERYPNAGYGRFNEDREARNYRNQFEPQNNRNQQNTRNRNDENTNYGFGNNRQQSFGNENDQQRSNIWESQNDQGRFGTERWGTENQNTQNTQSYRGKGPKGYVRSNERITEDINERLSDDDRVDASSVEVKVENNEVILTGNVNSKEEKRRCEDIVESISGVNNVENRLRVSSKSGSNTNYSEKGQSSYRNDGSDRTNTGSETTEKSQQTDKNKAGKNS